MRKVLWLLVIVFFTSFLSTQKINAQSWGEVSGQEFYDALSPYGWWINDHQYGFVWIPNVSDDFRPYFTNGRWVSTEYGNTWVSSYPWGWACFHYGRWSYNEYYGWVWMPGYEWGPGWVAWRQGNGLCGWAPLYPTAVWEGGNYTCPDNWWIYMHPKRIYAPRYHNIWRSDYMEGPLHTQSLLERTSYVSASCVVNNIVYYAGPTPAMISGMTRQAVPVYKTDSVSVRGGDMPGSDFVYIYRLALTENGNSRPAPANFEDAPEPVGKPEEIQKDLAQHHAFKKWLPKRNPVFSRPFVNDVPAYYNYPRKQIDGY